MSGEGHSMSTREMALEAQCSAMREALVAVASLDPWPAAPPDGLVLQITAALGDGAGAALLERLRRYRKTADAVRAVIHPHGHIEVDAKRLEDLRSALAQLKE